jgi:hypothetical protein
MTTVTSHDEWHTTHNTQHATNQPINNPTNLHIYISIYLSIYLSTYRIYSNGSLLILLMMINDNTVETNLPELLAMTPFPLSRTLCFLCCCLFTPTRTQTEQIRNNRQICCYYCFCCCCCCFLFLYYWSTISGCPFSSLEKQLRRTRELTVGWWWCDDNDDEIWRILHPRCLLSCFDRR